jgi:hypothetical protein
VQEKTEMLGLKMSLIFPSILVDVLDWDFQQSAGYGRAKLQRAYVRCLHAGTGI